MGLHRIRMDLGVLRPVGRRPVSLRDVGLHRSLRLGLDTRNRLGPGVGHLDLQRQLRRLGAAAAEHRLRVFGIFRPRDLIATAGSGYPEPSGPRRGSPGPTTTTTSAGRRCRRASSSGLRDIPAARSDRYGWVWIPGTVWAPAWVTWTYNDNYVGWAPLPPSIVFGSSGYSGRAI